MTAPAHPRPHLHARTAAGQATSGVTLYADGLDRLIEYDTNVSTRLVYDGANAAAEIDNPPGAIQRRYVWGDGADELLVDYVGSGTATRRFTHADERGSIVALSDSSGNMIAINRYDEYGKPQGTNVGRFQYTGQMWLGEAGVYNYKARMYAPHLGRFLQTDPIGVEGGINLYAYVGNDPVNWVDPSGLIQSRECDTGTTQVGYDAVNDNVYCQIDPVQRDIVVTKRRPGRRPNPLDDDQATPQRTPSDQPKPNGCGAAGGPSIPLFKGCDAHDICYASSEVNKETCDSRFLADMKKECRASFTCNSVAHSFYFLVRNFGKRAFDDARRLPDQRRFNDYIKSLQGN